MRRVTVLVMSAVLMLMSGITLFAHEETYKGTVMTVVPAKIQVKVIDEKTKKESTMDFTITARTKVLRGEKVVTFAEANIQKDERIVVTVNHDVSMTDATVVRLAIRD